MANELEEFARVVGDYISDRKKPVEDAIQDEIRLLLKQVIRFTPPKTKSQGLKRTEKDIRYSVGDLDAMSSGKELFKTLPQITDPRLRTLIQKRQDNVLNRIFAKRTKGVFAGATVGPFDPKLHTRNRNKRGGVRRRRKYQRVTTDRKAVNAYVRDVKKHVGMAKGGWAKAYQQFGGRPPKWIADHRNMGSVQDASRKPLNPFIRVVNKSPWTQRHGSGPFDATPTVKNAMRSRVFSIRKKILLGHVRAIKSKLNRLNRAA